MNLDSTSDLRNQKPLTIITEYDVVEAVANAGLRGEVAVLERFTPNMMHGALTRGALFQLAFIVEDADTHADLGLLYSAILLQAASIVLGGDQVAWSQLRTRPGKLGAFVSALAAPDNEPFREHLRMLRDTKPSRLYTDIPSATQDVFDIVLSRLNFSFEMLSYLHDHFHDQGIKSIIRSLLALKERELAERRT